MKNVVYQERIIQSLPSIPMALVCVTPHGVDGAIKVVKNNKTRITFHAH